MQCYQVKKTGGLDNLIIVDSKVLEPLAGQVLVRWRASSLNYHDYMVAVGGIPCEDGRVPMSDGAGEVVAVGKGVTTWKNGRPRHEFIFP